MLDEESKAVAEVSKTADTFIERVSNACGLVFESYQLKRMAKAKVEVQKIEATAPFEVAQAIISKSEEFTGETMNPLEKNAIARRCFEETRNQENLESIIFQALPLIEDDAKPEEIEEDWLSLCIDKAKKVSNKKMQSIWAKVLAGEATKQGSFSKRTLNFIEELEQEDAGLFTTLCGFGWVVEEFQPIIFNRDDAVYKNANINFDTLNHLASIGLISMATLSYITDNKAEERTISYYGLTTTVKCRNENIPITGILLGGEPKEKKYVLDTGKVLLTQTGKELASICGATSSDEFYQYAIKYWEGLASGKIEYF